MYQQQRTVQSSYLIIGIHYYTEHTLIVFFYDLIWYNGLLTIFHIQINQRISFFHSKVQQIN